MRFTLNYFSWIINWYVHHILLQWFYTKQTYLCSSQNGEDQNRSALLDPQDLQYCLRDEPNSRFRDFFSSWIYIWLSLARPLWVGRFLVTYYTKPIRDVLFLILNFLPQNCCSVIYNKSRRNPPKKDVLMTKLRYISTKGSKQVKLLDESPCCFS